MGLRLWQVPGLGPIYGPENRQPAPVVLILHGSEGAGSGWSHRFAAILAAHGLYACPYAYGAGDVWGAGDIRGVDISRIDAAGRTLAALPESTAVHLFGWSRGGELALHLGAIGGAAAPWASIAAHAPADHCRPAFDTAAFRAGQPQAEANAAAPRAWLWPGHDTELVPGTPIAIDRFPRPVFLSVGDADEIWDYRMTLRLADLLAASGNPADLWVAPGQGHAFDFDIEPELWARLLHFFAQASPAA